MIIRNRQTVYAFIDSQNLHLGVSTSVEYRSKIIYDGWELDFKKFRKFLRNKYRIDKAYLFIGFVSGNEGLYEYLQDAGYILIFKPTLEHKKADRKFTKGNVDAELVLHSAARQFEYYDKAVIVSGDGDFHCLYEYLIEKNKLLKILVPNKHRYSSLLRKFSNYFDFVSTNKKKLEKTKKRV